MSDDIASRLRVTCEVEELDRSTKRAFAHVTVDGVGCGRLLLISGPTSDVEDFLAGAGLEEIRERWTKKVRS